MSRLPVISGLQLMKALTKLGFVQHRTKGSHAIMVRDSPRKLVSVPLHAELDRGTLRSIIREAGIDAERLRELL
jgi:predicted RNA binding protein YcfA (HicA-like mRNA interferase family)